MLGPDLFGCKDSLLQGNNAAYLEKLYSDYLKDKTEVSLEWRQYFEALEASVPETGSHLIKPAVITTDVSNVNARLLAAEKQGKVYELMGAYRLFGHLHADIDPLKQRPNALVPELMLPYYHLSDQDLSMVFDSGTLPGARRRTLLTILSDLKKIYCGAIASEFMHIPDAPERIWVQEQVERMAQMKLPNDTQKRLLECIIAAEGLEKYLGAKYPGAKRFSLEGTDSLVVALDTIIQKGGASGVKEVIIGMAHRGRLNVLVNLLGKMPSHLFDEFEGKHYDEQLESGDVKYHQGFSSDVSTPGGAVHLSLAFNPSHLEIVAPVVCGSVKARQERRGDKDFKQVLSIAVHGDAAFAGQGVVMETLNMSKTLGFNTGGTIHIIVNNQIGFTTSDVQEARSTLYCSDIGKMMEIPIFHVNADVPEAVYKSVQLALRYREKFKKDVIIDLVGYRRHGHNEADEPSATQPLMYQLIRKMPTVCALYSEKLIQDKVLLPQEVVKLSTDYRDALENKTSTVVKNLLVNVEHAYQSDWNAYLTKDWRVPTKTSVELSILKALGEKQTCLPQNFVLHPRVQKIVEDRKKMTAGELPLDWGYAETLAYATLLNDQYVVRLSGQDVGRGTFFHRHAVLYNQEDGSQYVPLCHLSENQGNFYCVRSLLSEAAVLGFEYGFSQTEPAGLIIWEAQFGDFANNAQGVIDQFISSGQQKWGRLSGLTLLLPHGYEGQGPEHSSARLERYLQLCAENNMQVCSPTTPAQMFHLLRRQVVRSIRKPLIIMTPKSFLRHKLAVSSLSDLAEGSFLPVLPEIDPISNTLVTRVILCSGKIYYDLLEKRRQDKLQEVAIIRVEQLYPFPDVEIIDLLNQYSNAKRVVWCQEEPKNQGAWRYMENYLGMEHLQGKCLQYAGRQESAAPAVGYMNLHQSQQSMLVKAALIG